ncbi:MAG: NAD(P)-dependent alcohol dehydrogenase [Colwellia sp.]|nr:NAD(P)-dependent alcohol dehydrogenase [Colwellia sp.]
MKAVICRRFGAANKLTLTDVATPVPSDQQLLIKVMATTVTAGDCEIRSLRLGVIFNFMLRIFSKFSPLGLGMELAGEVIAVGKKVSLFKVGDKVMAAPGFKANAQFICLAEDAPVVLKPTNMNNQEAAAISVGGTNALHFLRKAAIKPNEKVLIYGASGSIGTAAIQLAKYYGAHVTTVCSTSNLALVQSLGADNVIDYSQENYAEQGQEYDVIFDTLGKSLFKTNIKLLSKNGRYLLAAPKFREIIKGFWLTKTSTKKVITAFANHNAEQLSFLKKLVEQKQFTAVIDRIYPLEDIVAAHLYVEKGHKKGNVVITVSH